MHLHFTPAAGKLCKEIKSDSILRSLRRLVVSYTLINELSMLSIKTLQNYQVKLFNSNITVCSQPFLLMGFMHLSPKISSFNGLKYNCIWLSWF